MLAEDDDGFIEEVNRLSKIMAILQGYTIIETAEDLYNIRNDLDGKFILMNDIDLSGYENWDPIGRSQTGSFSEAFQGTFNGNGYVIKNLTINRPDEEYVGLFGYTNGANIENVGLENVNVTGGSKVGGLAGTSITSGEMSNCYATGSVRGEDNVGGLAG